MSAPASTPEPQPSTERKGRPGGDRLRSTFSLPQRWLAQHQIITLCVAIAIIVPLFSLWFVASTVSKMKEAVWIWNVDDSGSFTWAPAAIADPSSRLYREVSMQAAEAYLKRNPEGLSNPEIAARYFTGEVWRAVARDISSQASDRKRRNLYDQIEFTRQPERLDPNSTMLRYRVVGYIIRSGVIDGLAQRDVGEFRMGIELTPQSQIREKGRFPFQVSQYRVTIAWKSDGREEQFVSVGAAAKSQGGAP